MQWRSLLRLTHRTVRRLVALFWGPTPLRQAGSAVGLSATLAGISSAVFVVALQSYVVDEKALTQKALVALRTGYAVHGLIVIGFFRMWCIHRPETGIGKFDIGNISIVGSIFAVLFLPAFLVLTPQASASDAITDASPIHLQLEPTNTVEHPSP